MACPHVFDCELYPQFSLKATLRVWQTNYCAGDEADYGRCARYQLSQQGEPVPLSLLPNGKHISLPALKDDPG